MPTNGDIGRGMLLGPVSSKSPSNPSIATVITPGLLLKCANLLFFNNAASPAASGSGSFIDASGFKFSEKDTKPGKIKLKKAGKLGKKKGEDNSIMIRAFLPAVTDGRLCLLLPRQQRATRFPWLVADPAGDR